MPDQVSLSPPPLSTTESTVFHMNAIIRYAEIDTNKISDGYHTFGELYNHRIELYIALCKQIYLNEMSGFGNPIWRSKKQYDGNEWEGWFLLGINQELGKQITYHLPISRWGDCEFAEDRAQAPPFDGHTSNDVIERLKTL